MIGLYCWMVAAFAGPYVVDVGEVVGLPVGGLWARAEPADAGWSFFWAAGGDLRNVVLTDELTLDDRQAGFLTGRSDLIDHAIAHCPDGTWLHAASSQVNAPNDTARLFHYDAEWNLLAQAVVVEAATDTFTNDMILLCTDAARLVAFSGPQGRVHVYPIEDDLSTTELPLQGYLPQIMGGSMAWVEERGQLVSIGRAYGQPVWGRWFTLDGVVDDDELELPLSTEGEDAYWPQRTLRVGEHWVVVYMWRPDDGTFAADEGNVRLAVFDLDWNLVELVRLTDYPGPTGGMRPWITRKGDQLLALWDKEQVPQAVLVTLDLDALGSEGDADSGSDGGSDSGSPLDGGGGEACGCGGGGPARPALGALLLAFALGSRRHGRT